MQSQGGVTTKSANTRPILGQHNRFVWIMLTVDPKKRITAEAAMTHPWIGKASDNKLGVDNLKKYQASRKLKKATKKLIAMQRMKLLAAAKPA